MFGVSLLVRYLTVCVRHLHLIDILICFPFNYCYEILQELVKNVRPLGVFPHNYNNNQFNPNNGMCSRTNRILTSSSRSGYVSKPGAIKCTCHNMECLEFSKSASSRNAKSPLLKQDRTPPMRRRPFCESMSAETANKTCRLQTERSFHFGVFIWWTA